MPLSRAAGLLSLGLWLTLAACAERETPSPPPLAYGSMVYCYSTLADADCYSQPQAGEGLRLIAVGPHWTIYFR